MQEMLLGIGLRARQIGIERQVLRAAETIWQLAGRERVRLAQNSAHMLTEAFDIVR